MKKIFYDFNRFIKYKKDDQNFINPYPGFENIYDYFELFTSKFKIKYETNDRFYDYNDDSDRFQFRYCYSDGVSD